MRTLFVTLAATGLWFSAVLASAKEPQLTAKETPYKKGDIVPVTCLNRTTETGEHIIDSQGNLQYIPFPKCIETDRPLALKYMISGPQNCTIILTDELFHMFEFYVHNDVPLTCRIPTHLSSGAAGAPESAEAARAAIAGETGHGALGAESDRHVRMVVALGGTLQRSHLHVANALNMLLHSSAVEKGVIDTAAAYSVSPATRNQRIVIGDKLTFEMNVGWYDGNSLPSAGSQSSGGMSSWSRFFLQIIGVSIAVMLIYLTRTHAPGFWKKHIASRLPSRKATVLPKYNGYGFDARSSGSEGFSTGMIPKKE